MTKKLKMPKEQWVWLDVDEFLWARIEPADMKVGDLVCLLGEEGVVKLVDGRWMNYVVDVGEIYIILDDPAAHNINGEAVVKP